MHRLTAQIKSWDDPVDSIGNKKAPQFALGALETAAFGGANDGARTRDNQNHNLGLYQLSYVRH